MCSLSDNIEAVKSPPSIRDLDQQIGLVLAAMESMSDRIDELTEALSDANDEIRELKIAIDELQEDVVDVNNELEESESDIYRELKKKVDKV